MKFRIKLFAIISGIFIPLNSANAFSEAEYNYGFYWGGLNAICGAYMDLQYQKEMQAFCLIQV